jgi:hypothetical protein
MAGDPGRNDRTAQAAHQHEGLAPDPQGKDSTPSRPARRPPAVRKPPHGTPEYIAYLRARFDAINLRASARRDREREIRDALAKERDRKERRARYERELLEEIMARDVAPPGPPRPRLVVLPKLIVKPRVKKRRYAVKDKHGRVVGYALMD